MIKIWKHIPGLEEYEVSNFGDVQMREHTRVYQTDPYLEVQYSAKPLPAYKTNGYLYVNICGEKHKIHRLVAEAFIPNPDNLPWVKHVDGNLLNNSADNLMWSTPANNLSHSPTKGTKVMCREDNKVFRSIKSAALEYGLDYDKLNYAIKHNKPLGGMHITELE